MILASSLRNALGFVKRTIGYRSIATASLIQRNLPHVIVPLHPEGGRIKADEIGLFLDPTRHAFFLPLLPLARDLVREGGGSFGLDALGDPEYRVGDLRLVPENVDDLAILHEIYARRLYEMEDRREWFVLDIGMNVGYSALFFAGTKGWEVMAYEPFPTTFERAIANIERNELSGLVYARKAAVADRNATIEIAFNESARSTNGLFGNLQQARRTSDERTEIDLVDAADVLDEAITRAGTRPILIKLDCEGAEYEILDRLVEKNLLGKVEALIVEIHFIMPEHTSSRIRSLLLDQGYFLKTLWTGTEAEGLLAVRLKV